jgi:membrane associated rhomboid family serine protease
MSDEKSSRNTWVLVLQFIAVVLILWAVVTLISGLQFAEIFPDDPDMGRAYAFEDTGIANYGTYAWIGGIIGAVVLAVTYFLGKNKE